MKKTKTLKTMVSNRQKRKRLVMRTFAMVLFMALFTQFAQAQTNNVYMHSGTQNVTQTLNFYDSGGPESPDGSYFWEKQYKPNENATLTFKDGNNKIQITFKKFQGWSDTGWPDYTLLNLGADWSARLNDDYLYIYDGESADDDKLIVELTGNIKNAFTITANGPLTVKFVSNARYNGEGWSAEVKSVTTAGINKPIVCKDECGDFVNILNPNLEGTVYYTTNGNDPDPNDPLTNSQAYQGPIPIDLSASNASVTVKAISFISAGNASTTSTLTLTHNDQRPTPGVPTVTISGNTVTMKPATNPGLDETYNVVYTTDGSEPTATNGTVITAPWNPIEWHTPNVTFKVATIAVKANCNSLVSEVVTREFGDVTVPTPEITFDANGNASITCSFDEATIYYTIDGSEPNVSNVGNNGPTYIYSAPFAVTPGTTVKAYANYAADGYLPSAVASQVYVPAGGSNTYGSIVLLDDREPHTWSYYTNDSPIHSLNPRDIKITYYGNSPAGRTTMTNASENGNTPTSFSATATGVKVGIASTENQDQFIYLKTLEAANENGSGNYPYTMIPNPFQVRPMGQGGTVQSPTRTLYISGTVYGDNNQRFIRVTYTDENNQPQTWERTSTGSGNTTITVKAGTTITLTARGREWHLLGSDYSTITARYADSSTATIGTVTANSSNYNTSPYANQTYTVNATSITVPAYRGFYAWRIKSLSDGLTIQRANGDNVAVNGIIDADEEIKFVTSKEEGNEVEFEALWAQAYVTTGSTDMTTYVPATVTNAYERNFHVVTSSTSASSFQKSYPCTISSYYPDGTSGGGSLTGGFSAAADTKIENISVTSAGSSNWNANGHYFAIGRGVSGTINRLRGLTANATTDFNLRVESGTFNYLYFMGNYGLTSGGKLTAVMGSDYARAKKDNSTPKVNTDILGSNEGSLGSSDTNGADRLHITVKSGNYDLGSYGGSYQFYLSSPNSSNVYGSRSLLVEGGIFSDISGGWDSEVTDTDHNRVTIRIKGGTINGAVYGAAQHSNAYGNRRIIITGGNFAGWIAGGANGTDEEDGTLNGTASVYFGGKANVTGTNTVMNRAVGGNVFGAGCGYNASSTSGQATGGTTVVIADEAVVQRGVYGGGSYGYTTATANVHILGGTINAQAGGVNGTTYTANIKGGVFGGASQNRGGITNVTMKDGTVNGGIYGGSNYSGTVSGLATVTISGGTAENVFGGGLGSSTSMSSGTNVSVSGGTINNNVYGGGEQGSVTGNTVVAISGGTMNEVYGAGLGTKYTGNWPPTAANANISGTTTVNVSGGKMANVYGGGENGSVAFSSTTSSTSGKSTVNISDGEVTGSVYGGGQMGTTQGSTTVNVTDGIIRGNVFAGAYGEQQKVFVTGLRTLNITGGHVYSHVYGGSRNANDGNDLSRANSTFVNYNGTEKICVTNISGGTLDENVYAAGYYGNCFGSVYAFIGQNAIKNAPNHTPTEGITYSNSNLNIGGSVWAGGDWGTFSGSFGGNTISGNSNVYVDGLDYETETTQSSNSQYMNIGGSVLACGTSCHAGKAERTIIIRNYGKADGNAPAQATRTLFSVQFAKVLIFDNANINFTGQGRINSLVTTEKYSIYEIYNDAKTTANADTDVDGVRIVNGSGLFLNAPATQLANFRSMSCENVYASTTPTLEGYTAVTPTTLPNVKNKVRVNNGTFVEIKYNDLYGPLIGYAYMMASTNNDDATCAYARPKNCYTTPIDNGLNNPDDGGWVSYTASENTFNLDGSAAGTIQMPYENHTVAKNGEIYFRIWRAGGVDHYREGIFDAAADGSATFSYVDVVITLPAFRNNTAYYRFETSGDEPNMNTTIDYGADVLTFNSALVGDNSWISYNESQDIEQTSAIQSAQDQIIAQPDVNFGLVAINGQGMGLTTKDGSATSGFIICNDADAFLAEMTRDSEQDPYYYVNKFTCADNTQIPQVTFRLTYYNKLSANMTWDPMKIVLVQCDANGNVTDRVTIALAVNTSASIEQEFTTDVYAVMQGTGSSSDQYVAKVVLPQFSLCTSGVESNFTLNSVSFVPANGGNIVERGSTGANAYNYNNFAVEYGASLNYDNTDGWNGLGTGEHDTYPMTLTNPTAELVGKAGGREQFAIDFKLIYDGGQTHTGETQLMGTLTYNITFDNYLDSEGNCQSNQTLTIVVKVWRRGQGSNFYLDGVNGDNAFPKDVLAKYPNRAAKSLSTIFNRCGYLAGDVIYVVNKVTADNSLIWNGLSYSNVTLYRYNGGHPLATNAAQGSVTIIGNANNDPYKGEFLVANNKVSLTGITLDGYYEDPFATNSGNGKGETPETSVTSTAPLIVIGSNGTVELSKGTVLQNNNNSAGNGGAVLVNDGGTLKMNQDALIKDNLVASGDGAGVYMGGTMIVSDDIMIIDNKKGTTQNNVYLTAADKVVTIGTAAANDEYDELSNKAKIGVTKDLYGNVDGYTEVVNVDADIDWLETPYNSNPNAIIYHDLGKYQLEKYNDPTYLYWIGTWVTVQDWNPKYESAEADGYNANDFDPSNIDTAEELAWFISHVNGLNGADPHPTAVANITADIDMSTSIWVPIGSMTHAFKGTFEGNGHVIKGMHSPLVQTNMGMIGNAEGATVQNVIANVAFEANAANMGTFIGSMSGGTLSNVEAAGSLIGGSNTINMGGLVGLSQPIEIEGTSTKPTIHSAFAVNGMTGGANTVMGGLVGNNGGNLYNSYANTILSGNTNKKGGLVGVNNEGCTVENCYVVLGQQEMAGFAYTNNGSINYCYADKAGTQVAEGSGTVSFSGTYSAVKDRKAYGYMYDDNKVTAENNNYVKTTHEYKDNHTVVWDGLLSVLNQWVAAGHTSYSTWNRPLTKGINGDLPILAFPKDNCVGNFAEEDGKLLYYSASDEVETDAQTNNGLDALLTHYSGKAADIYLYKSAVGVTNGSGNANLFIHEDAALLQAAGSKADINATVGVTFDNSYKKATTWNDLIGDQKLTYDWHFLSSPLDNAPLGIDWKSGTFNWWQTNDDAQVASVSGSYFPDDINTILSPNHQPDTLLGWDIYTFFEPQYHWINLKRNSNSHYHYDEQHENIVYKNETTFERGKGYMMAIETDSYLSNTGKLTNEGFTVDLSYESPEDKTERGCNFIGNPYHAYFDLNAFFTNTDNSANGINCAWVYIAEQNNYVPYLMEASNNPITPAPTIHPHQGFFVKVAAKNLKARFTTAMATATQDNSYYRGDQVNYPLVNLFAYNEAGQRDFVVVEFNRPDSGGAGKMTTLRNAPFTLTAQDGQEEYTILFTGPYTKRVPIRFTTIEDGTYTLKWETYHGTFGKLILVDNITGASCDMTMNDHYTFEGHATDYANRFYLIVESTDVDEFDADNDHNFAYFNGSEWIVYGEGQLDLVDMTGRVLYSKYLAGETNSVSFGNVAAGVYVIRFGNKAQKIIIR